jgi:hypothetical protein
MAKENTAKTTKVVTDKVRFSYVHIFQPHAVDANQEAKFSMVILIPKSDKKTLRKIKAAIDEAKELGKPKWGGKIPAALKLPLRDGDEERPDQDEYANGYFINCISKTKPGIVDRNTQEILDSSEVYSGCYGRVSVNFYPFAVSGNKGIACGLNNIQKLSDGEFLGGRSKPEDDFSEEWDDDEEEGNFLD